jgi:predicted nucleic acid-binding protein
LKLIDAIHVATALESACAIFITDDLRPRVPHGLRKMVLRESDYFGEG